MGGSLIDNTLMEIANNYQAGLLPWVKKERPEQWGRMLNIESRINTAALSGNKISLTLALEAYKRFFSEALSVYGQGNLFGGK